MASGMVAPRRLAIKFAVTHPRFLLPTARVAVHRRFHLFVPMNGSIRLLTTLCAASLVLAGCKKKPGDEAANSATPDAVASAGDNSKTPAASSTPSAAVASELAATDVAYEAWFKKYRLDLNDPNMLDADPDGDGYTNREEFLADTNPTDPDSRPGVHATLRLKEFNEIRVPYMLKSVDGETAKVEHQDGGETKVEIVKVGQTLRGSQLKVEKVEALQTQDKDGNPIDASKVTLEDTTAPGQKIDLVKDMPTRSSASYAVLHSKAGDSNITVKQGDTFEWPAGSNTHYRVIDLRSDQVVLEQVENKKMWTVPKK
jgi:hypothetical protein